MTKIAISPNINGTGTFTIAAPDSNTDRTLTLPDAGGEVFSQGSILGTVSESSGVPTGAIIERGSNANGEFVKFADGTMICFTGNSTTPVSNTLTTSSHSWPAAFIDPPRLASNVESTVLGTSLTGMTGNNATETGYSQTVLRSNTQTTRLEVVAIGRWF